MTARSASRACRSRSRNSSARPIGMGSPRAGGEIGHVRPVDGRDSESFVVTRRPFAIEPPLFSRLDRHRHRLGAARSRSADAEWLRPRPGADQWFAGLGPRHSCGRNHDHFGWDTPTSTNTSEDLMPRRPRVARSRPRPPMARRTPRSTTRTAQLRHGAPGWHDDRGDPALGGRALGSRALGGDTQVNRTGSRRYTGCVCKAVAGHAPSPASASTASAPPEVGAAAIPRIRMTVS